ncbi:chloroperoxidase-like protein [Wolfiporia cocos MD-104 SS10]|uniref:Chloroperoxidase-like protein n=1 Tax=Wolfiporia cocos (strain MD-104) TaxID=742152 RepID=A0A2H3J3Q4_WOLCO|nr:chloroperoxidase-like protein [Wolfiporia cocos MD-104 SS10]
MPSSFLSTASKRVLVGLLSNLLSVFQNIGLLGWDLGLTLYNIVAPERPASRVIPEGCPGAGGKWPPYIPPGAGDSRSACPALNILANHGIIPRSGRDISFRQVTDALHKTYNFSQTFCFFVPSYAAGMLNKSYWTDTFDLEDVNVHNGIEHDGSLTRRDTFHVPDQSRPDPKLIEELLASGTGPGGNLTAADLSRVSGKRRSESRKRNNQFSLSTFHKLFGSSNTSTLVTLWGGRVRDLAPILLEERIPDGWQPCITRPAGLTILEYQKTVLRIELGIKEEVEDAFATFTARDKKAA